MDNLDFIDLHGFLVSRIQHKWPCAPTIFIAMSGLQNIDGFENLKRVIAEIHI